jgi:hypothetical protein
MQITAPTASFRLSDTEEMFENAGFERFVVACLNALPFEFQIPSPDFFDEMEKNLAARAEMRRHRRTGLSSHGLYIEPDKFAIASSLND